MYKNIKLLVSLMSICFMILLTSITSHAQEATISYTDLEVPAGQQFNVNIKVEENDGDAIGNVTIKMNYDSSQIQFMSGEGITSEGNVLTYNLTGDGSSTEYMTPMTFTALKFGTSTITISEVSGTLADGTPMSFVEGSSTITIAGGTEVAPTPQEAPVEGAPAADAGIVIQGVNYTVVSELPANKLPDGFIPAVANYNGGQINVAKEESSGIIVAYLANEAGEQNFFMYNEQTGVFSPFVRMIISETSSIVFLETPTETSLDERYVETSLNVSNFVFPTWQDTEMPGFYLINAMNNLGETSLYKYDVQEQTYQRYLASESSLVDTEAQVEEESFIDKIPFVHEYGMYMLIGIGAIFLIILIILIVVSVKLRNRNLELDDLYEEYGIDEEFDEIPVNPSNGKNDKKNKDEFEFEFLDDDEDDYDFERLEKIEASTSRKSKDRKMQDAEALKEAFEEDTFEEDSFEEDSFDDDDDDDIDFLDF